MSTTTLHEHDQRIIDAGYEVAERFGMAPAHARPSHLDWVAASHDVSAWASDVRPAFLGMYEAGDGYDFLDEIAEAGFRPAGAYGSWPITAVAYRCIVKAAEREDSKGLFLAVRYQEGEVVMIATDGEGVKEFGRQTWVDES